MLHGTLVGIGLILLSLGARYLPAAEFMLLSLTEVVGGVIWCWIPLFGVNEVPSNITLMGGLVIMRLEPAILLSHGGQGKPFLAI